MSFQIPVFALFIVLLALGAASILFDRVFWSPFAPIWWPPTAVAIYSVLLQLNVAPGGEARQVWVGSAADSPYFLGFLLTLVALYHTLTSVATGGPTGTTAEGLLRDAGAALLPTGVGLLARQFFTSQGDLATREAQVTESATFAAIHTTLQTLVRVTEVSLHRDEKALEKVLAGVTEAIGKIDEDLIVGHLRTAHLQLIDALQMAAKTRAKYLDEDMRAAEQWRQTIHETTTQIERLTTETTAAVGKIKSTGEWVDGATKRATEPMIQAYARLTNAIQELDRTLDDRYEALRAKASALVTAVDEQTKATDKALVQLNDVATKARDASEGFTSASATLVQAARAADGVPTALARTADAIAQSALRLEQSVDAVVSPVHREAKEIDLLVLDLTRILTEHVASLEQLRA